MTKPIKVLHLFANLNLGGAESRIMDIYRTQNEDLVINDFVIMTNEHCYFTDEVLSSGGTIHVIANPRNGLLRNLRALYTLLKKQNDYDAIHAHTSYYSGLCVFVAFLAGIKKRVTHARNKSTGDERLITKMLFFTGRLLANNFATSRLAISQDAGEFLYGKRVLKNFNVVPNAFNFSNIRHQQADSIGEDKHKYNIQPNVINIVAVARFYAIKNHNFMINLLSSLQRQGHRCCLHLIGDGDLRGEIEQQVKQAGLTAQVRFWGKRSDVPQLLALFDVMLMPSLSEGLGVSALEAQAAGLPCLLSSGIPHEADIGAGLCEYHALSAEINDWVDALLRLNKLVVPNKVEIDQLFEREGYTLSSTRATYLQAYS